MEWDGGDGGKTWSDQGDEVKGGICQIKYLLFKAQRAVSILCSEGEPPRAPHQAPERRRLPLKPPAAAGRKVVVVYLVLVPYSTR